MGTKSAASRRGFRGWVLAVCACALLPGCFTFTHTSGRGPMSPQPVITRETQWFALWGVVPIKPIDSAELAGTTLDYRVTTEFTFMDALISAFTSFVSFYRQSIVIEK